MYLSPQAAKAKSRAASRRVHAYVHSTPRPQRTKSNAIILPPIWREYRRSLASQMPELLPDFIWNSHKNWWQGPLEQLQLAFDRLNEVTGTTIPISDGAKMWLDEGR